jgi:hypothetical protein
MTTIQSIAERLGVRPHRIAYIVKARRIEPAAWVGHTRVFSEQAVAQIVEQLEANAGKRQTV